MMVPLLLALAFPGCVDVDGPQILARDLARAHTAFAALPPEMAFGFTPAPGARRLLNAAELKRRAAPQDLALDAMPALCVVRATGTLAQDKVLDAMRVSLGEAEASIEIVEVSRFPVPRGTIEFPRAGLTRPVGLDARQPVLWKGYVRYDERRRAPVWAKVRVWTRARPVVAVRDLRAGQVIDAAWLKVEERDVFPSAEPMAASVDEVAGRVLKAGVLKDAPLLRRLLAVPREVERGDRVQVEASYGAATVGSTGEAESAGAVGDTVLVRNLETGKRFRARVEGKGRVALRTAQGGQTWDTTRN